LPPRLNATRSWKSLDRKISVVAKITAADDKEIIVEDADGQKTVITLTNLSDADRRTVELWSILQSSLERKRTEEAPRATNLPIPPVPPTPDSTTISEKAEEPKTEAPKDTFRTWRSSDGQHEIKAKFVFADETNVILEREDGRVLTLGQTIFSSEDREYIKLRVEQEKNSAMPKEE